MKYFYILLFIFTSCNSLSIKEDSIIKVINQYLAENELQESQKFYLNQVKLSDEEVFDIYDQVLPENFKRHNKRLTLENGFLKNGKKQFVNKLSKKPSNIWEKEQFNSNQILVNLTDEASIDASKMKILKDISDISKARLFSISDILFDVNYKKAIVRLQILEGIGNAKDFVLVLLKKNNTWTVFDRINGVSLY